jgi:hypothetical protein
MNKQSNYWCLIISVILIMVVIYTLFDFNKSIEPFNNNNFKNMQDKLDSSLNHNGAGLNKLISMLKNKLDTPVLVKEDKVLTETQKKSLNNKVRLFHDEIVSNNFKFEKGIDGNTEIEKLNLIINDLDNELIRRNLRKTLKQNYSGIKSHNNGLELKIDPIDLNRYLIKMNGGCLGINGLDYDVYKCNKNDKSQHFRLENIFNDYAYKSQATHDNYVEGSKNIKYPFVMAKSVSNNNCVSNNHNKLRIMPCDMVKSQRWNTLNTDVCHQ